MKEEKTTTRKKRKEPLYGVMDGWNFGMGLWASLTVWLLVIIPAISLLLWIILILFGSALGALL